MRLLHTWPDIIFLGDIKQRQRCHVGTQLDIKALGPCMWRGSAETPDWGCGLSLKGASCEWSRSESLGVAVLHASILCLRAVAEPVRIRLTSGWGGASKRG